MIFADKCKLLGKRRGRNAASANRDNKLRAALLPKPRWAIPGKARSG